MTIDVSAALHTLGMSDRSSEPPSITVAARTAVAAFVEQSRNIDGPVRRRAVRRVRLVEVGDQVEEEADLFGHRAHPFSSTKRTAAITTAINTPTSSGIHVDSSHRRNGSMSFISLSPLWRWPRAIQRQTPVRPRHSLEG